MSDIYPYNSVVTWVGFKLGVLFSSLFAFFFLSRCLFFFSWASGCLLYLQTPHRPTPSPSPCCRNGYFSVTALLVRVLISSGVVVLFPMFWAMQVRILPYLNPYLGPYLIPYLGPLVRPLYRPPSRLLPTAHSPPCPPPPVSCASASACN